MKNKECLDLSCEKNESKNEKNLRVVDKVYSKKINSINSDNEEREFQFVVPIDEQINININKILSDYNIKLERSIS